MKTREDVVAAIRKLLAELEADPGAWENATLDQYLEAMAAWLDGYGRKHSPEPSWEFIQRMLEAAKKYE